MTARPRSQRSKRKGPLPIGLAVFGLWIPFNQTVEKSSPREHVRGQDAREEPAPAGEPRAQHYPDSLGVDGADPPDGCVSLGIRFPQLVTGPSESRRG